MGSARQANGERASPKEPREVRNGTGKHGHGLSEEEESRILEADDLPKGDIAAASQQSDTQQQLQPPLIQWERFLPIKTLKVLLVENDDSTRHVVSAFLRSCSYEVITAENGLQAWKILEDLTNHIDLVLTEVSMPCLSGIGLLCKIMSHKTCKNIPVIMMSSNDSMGTVFNCLSKGAVDFLVKPIRKNELKNLWQHVWRRCHSSSGSGSESGIQTQKCTKSKSGDESDNNSGSNDDDDNGSVGLNARDGSDNGSGTQGSWTKRAVEIDSPQPLSPSDQLADQPDSTCAQVIHPKPEEQCNGWLPMTTNRNSQKQKEFHDDFMGKDLEIGVPRTLNSDYEPYPMEQASIKQSDVNLEKMSQRNPKNERLTGLDNSNTFEEPTTQAADLIGSIAKSIDAQKAARATEVPNGLSKVPEGNEKNSAALVEMPSLELSLKRLRSTGDGAAATQDERNVLKRSDLSAFTRYHTSAVSNQSLTGFGGSCSPVGNSSEAMKADSTYKMKSPSNAAQIKQGSNGSSNNNDKGSTTNNVVSKPAANKEKISSPTAVKGAQHTSAFHPVQFRTSASAPVVQEKVDEATAAAAGGQQREIVEQHYHHHYHHHHYHPVHDAMEQQESMDHNVSSLDQNLSQKNMAAAAPRCGSSNTFSALDEGHAENYSLNGSNSGSNHGSNGQNGSTTAANAGGVNMESANGVAEKSTAGGGNGSGGSVSGSGVYQNRFAQREAALNKFRQKRKERNFGKKVRYQSRKRLAEQRPRVRGQFVRQPVHEKASRKADR